MTSCAMGNTLVKRKERGKGTKKTFSVMLKLIKKSMGRKCRFRQKVTRCQLLTSLCFERQTKKHDSLEYRD